MQLTFTGDEDLYLNEKPEITFFKKIYRRHTNFSSEFKEIKFNNQQKFEEKLNFKVKNQGDLLNDCYLEVEIPSLSLSDSIIDDSDYIDYKNDLLSSIKTKRDNWKTDYDNFKNFSEIELKYYQTLVKSLQSDNVTISILKSKVSTLNETYETDRNNYKEKIDSNILNQINIVNYINNLDSELISVIKLKLDKIYRLINKYLNYYYSNYINEKNKYDKLDEGLINYGWSEYLGHYYFNYYEVQLGGTKIDSYSSDQLHIFQSHNIDESRKDNYNKMVGHIDFLYNFNNEKRDDFKIYIPLVFWFCQSNFNSLPLISLKNSEITFNFHVNELENLIYFVDWESDYNKLLIVDVPYSDHQKNTNGSIIKISELNSTSVELILPEYIYRYKCKNINKKLLDLKYPGIDSTSVLENYGSIQDDNNYVMSLNEYVFMMNNLKDDIYKCQIVQLLTFVYWYFVKIKSRVKI